jgi:lipopolysaccharide export system protein LptA
MRDFKFLKKTHSFINILILSLLLISIIILFTRSYLDKKINKEFLIDEETNSAGILKATYKKKLANGSTLKIKSEKAINVTASKINFFKIQGSLLKGKDLTRFKSDEALYEEDLSYILFENNIIILRGRYEKMIALGGKYLIKENTLFADKKIDYISRLGEFIADKYNFNFNNNIFKFNKNIKIKIYKKGGNINLSSEIARLEYNNKKIFLDDNVKLRDKALLMNSDQAIIKLSKRNRKYKQLAKEVKAMGDVNIFHNKVIINGDRAKYLPNKHLVIINGNVLVNKDNNIARGDKLKYYLKTGIFKIYGKNNKDVDLKGKK